MVDLPSDCLEVQLAKQPVIVIAIGVGIEGRGRRSGDRFGGSLRAWTNGKRIAGMGRGQAGELWLGKREGSRGMAEICFQMVVWANREMDL
jgi:hypothetical protein